MIMVVPVKFLKCLHCHWISLYYCYTVIPYNAHFRCFSCVKVGYEINVIYIILYCVVAAIWILAETVNVSVSEM